MAATRRGKNGASNWLRRVDRLDLSFNGNDEYEKSNQSCSNRYNGNAQNWPILFSQPDWDWWWLETDFTE